MKLAESCRQYLNHCRINKRLSHHSIRAYERDLQQITEYLAGSTDINSIDREKLKQLISKLNQSELSQASIKRRIACLKAMFRWLEIEDYLSSNPFHKLETKIKLPHRLPRNIPREEISALLQTARLSAGFSHKERYTLKRIISAEYTKTQVNALTTLLAIELMLTTGIRVGELVTIQLEQIFWREGKIRILGKGHHERYVFLTDNELIMLLKGYLYHRTQLCLESHTNLLINSRGKPANTQFIRKQLEKLSNNSVVARHITPHMFRHSAACELLESGVDIRFVQRLLGHYSISTTEVYTHVTDNVLQEQISNAGVRQGLR